MPPEPVADPDPAGAPRIGVLARVPLTLAALLVAAQVAASVSGELRALATRGFGARGLALGGSEEERFASAGAAGAAAALVREHVPRRGDVLVVPHERDASERVAGLVRELALLVHPRRVRAAASRAPAAAAAELPGGGWLLLPGDVAVDDLRVRERATALGWQLVRVGGERR